MVTTSSTELTHRQTSGTTSSRPGGRAASIASWLSRTAVGRELLVFALIGVASTVAYAALFLVLRGITGVVAANAAALLVTAIGNTAANRRFTFGVRGGDRASMLRDQLAGLLALGIALLITTAAASVLRATAPDAGRLVELTVLVLANALATISRFVLLRAVVARRPVALTPIAARIDPGSSS